MKPKFVVTSFILIVFLFEGCNKSKVSCYEGKLFQEHKNDVCPMDCPGVIGCDGKTYCNECEAQRQGIKLK